MRLRAFLFVALLARISAAQTPDTSLRVPRPTVSGVVHDSIAHMPLAGAIVQLVAAEPSARFGRTVVSDSLGRFVLRDVPDGRYTIGFFHPMLDSLGIEPPLRAVFVNDQRPVRADLGVPSPARLRAAICGEQAVSESGAGRNARTSAVLVGVVRDARDGAPVAGVMVTGEWFEVTFVREGLVHRIPRLFATSAENGWFAMCNVPSTGTMALTASRGADSTDRIEVQVPEEGFVRRELYLGAARTVVTRDTVQREGPVAPSLRRMRLGDGRLSGTVVTVAGGRPLADALVSIRGGPQTRANDRGEWTLVDAPAGTRMLEVRAIGYYPDRRHVNVVAGSAPVRVALSTLEAVLDTVKVTANRYKEADFLGFQERRRSGTGRYITEADIARQQPLVISDIFRALPGIRVGGGTAGDSDRSIRIRGAAGSEWCSPAIYLDGSFVSSRLTGDDLDTWMRTKDVRGIEIYAGAGVPGQFAQGLRGGLDTAGTPVDPCGSILFWTK
jgi:Carboxypeptidase regulatory-like domain/TonB-dependent Receptor Plug Domain